MKKQISGAYLLYYDPHHINDGINKKILGQIKAMRRAGFKVDEVIMDYRLCGRSLKERFKLGSVLIRLPFISARWVPGFRPENYDFVYMRRPQFMNGEYIKLLKSIKRKNPNIKIILEIPSYPYDFELWKRKIDWPLGVKEKIARKKLSGYIDKIAEVSEVGRIFGVDTIQLDNGIDFDEIPVRTPIFDDVIDLCCVAVFQYWHNYERLLDGLYRYYEKGGKRKIKIHFVGDGPDKSKYEELTQKYGLVENVQFYGRLGGAQLQKVYDQSDLGVCGLGIYRIGAFYTKELKSREYLAVGLPTLTCCKLNLNTSSLMTFMYKIPNSDCAIDIESIVRFYDSLNMKSVQDTIDISMKIRDISKKLFDISMAYRPVIDYINASCGEKSMKVVDDFKKRWKMRIQNFNIQNHIRYKIIKELEEKEDGGDEARFLKKLFNEVSFFPYQFPEEYKINDIKVYKSQDGFPYVYHCGKPLYLKKTWDKRRCQEYYRSLIVEQDSRSPHKYLLSKERYPDSEDVVADIGAAEGIFSLEIIDVVNKIYLFECDPEWLEPLNKSFEKYKDKVEFVDKFIGENNTDSEVSLDTFFDTRDLTYLKADIEGAEVKMLNGGRTTFMRKIKKALITTYHRPYDEDKIVDFLEIYAFEYVFNPGYCFYVNDKNTFQYPYARRCVVFAHKNAK